ncbi:MAG TPA: PPOX class F420-dependent oxidoreductase [Nitrososphaeraceae archaeon]|nr:PPOX class F420-dependent oxidoreductase [Nitrososphaeraceae archaeon]
MIENILEGFYGRKYINLQTFKKNGEIVSTPVWFVLKNNEILFRSGRNSGKVKRIRNNNNVKLAICDIRGNIKGQTYTGIANFQDKSRYSEINSLFDKKYSLLSPILKIVYKLRKIDIVILSITLNINISK